MAAIGLDSETRPKEQRESRKAPVVCCRSFVWLAVTLRLKIAQKPCIVASLGPKALYYESLEP